MLVDVKQDVFTDEMSAAEFAELLRLFAAGQHIWFALDEDVLAVARGFLETHLPALRSQLDLAEKGTVAAIWGSQTVADRTVAVCAADLADHIHDLRQPSVVVVENVSSDGGFFEALLRAFGHAHLMYALSQGWLSFEHGGGADDGGCGPRQGRPLPKGEARRRHYRQ